MNRRELLSTLGTISLALGLIVGGEAIFNRVAGAQVTVVGNFPDGVAIALDAATGVVRWRRAFQERGRA